MLKFEGLIATTDGKKMARGSGESKFTRADAIELGDRVGKEVKSQCGPEFFDWEEAQKGLRAPVQEAVLEAATASSTSPPVFENQGQMSTVHLQLNPGFSC
eukprot:TRINITY_DN5710_c0_g1_i1.p2 TRINITY_DN5710_c0_g1~~TRINITY_DN5710_c0_g1_i1.p2  ORF type:complete len:101 (+),score=10.53 TRINITY_DN5710_c0_g1_i1:434-736(+)